MDTEQFLERLLPPGDFIILASKGPQYNGLWHAAFPRANARGAAKHVDRQVRENKDVWHACATYKVAAIPPGRKHLSGERTQDNVAQLKAFWVDLDLKRPGDGKDPSKVYPDLGAAVTWVKHFVATTGIPKPNLWVNSGYGLHLYWVVEDAMDRPTWQPYAEALKAAVIATGGLADMAVIADSARLLRPPGSLNFKNPALPATVKVIPAQSKSDYPNAMLLATLQPYVGTGPATTVVPSAGGLGPAPAFVQSSNLASSAQAGTARGQLPKDMSFALIASRCGQVKQSLANNGATDNRSIWYLGNLSLAHHTFDGDQFVHQVSSGHHGYTATMTDAMVAQIVAEKAKKDTGPPTCNFYNSNRPGICGSCPLFGKILSPWNAGASSGDGDLPKNYRRQNGEIQHSKLLKDGIVVWDKVIDGDVYGPALTTPGGVYNIAFTYELAGRAFPVQVAQIDIGAEVGSAIKLFGNQGVTLDRHGALNFGDFIVAWIRKLRLQSAERDDEPQPFGWVQDGEGKLTGFAVAGTLYRPDRTTDKVPGVDPNLAVAYKPRGNVDKWKRACELLCKDRPHAQLMIAASMASPLMKFAAQPGVVFNFYSRGSGIGKSSTCQVAQNVWATTNTMTMLGDTANAVRGKAGQARVMPVIWDELRVNQKNVQELTEFFFSLANGKDKTRMRADTTIREAKEWQCIMVSTSNAPLLEFVNRLNANSDAGSMRVMDFEVNVPRFPANGANASIIASAALAAGRVGEMLAAEYAAKIDAIAAAYKVWDEHMTADMNCMSEERFYLAGLACSFVAARIAKGLGLFDFDVPAMWAYARQNWLKIRNQASKAIASKGGLDIQEIFGRFLGEYSPNVVVTSCFKSRGISPGVFKVEAAPLQDRAPIVIHVGKHEQMLRFDLNTFQKWCVNVQTLSADEVVNEMKKQWHASEGKLMLGAGSPYGLGQRATLEVPLGHPDLIEYDIWQDPQQAPQGRAAPSTTVAGNQVKI